MVKPPRISPTFKKMRPQGPKLKRISHQYKAQKPEEAAKTHPESPQHASVNAPIKNMLAGTFVGAAIVALIVILVVAVPKIIDGINDIDDFDNTDTTDNTNNKGSSGYCSSDYDCAAFGQRYNGIAVCSSYDNLCHMCYSLRGETCISASTGCDANTYPERGVCLFRQGGRTYD